MRLSLTATDDLKVVSSRCGSGTPLQMRTLALLPANLNYLLCTVVDDF